LFGWAVTASAVQLAVHGEFGSKLQTTDSLGMISQDGSQGIITARDEIDNQDLDDTWAELQYRLWTVATSDDGNVKGVWAMEYGTHNFGSSFLGFANDNGDFEMRLAYVDFQLPYFQSENRLAVGLQEVDISKWLWAETAAGIRNYGSFDVGATKVAYQIGWARQSDNTPYYNSDNDSFETENNDADYWFAKVDFNLKDIAKVDNFDIGLFFVYANNQEENGEFTDNEPWWLGGEVQFLGFKGIEFEGTLIYEGGDGAVVNNQETDISAWFVAASAGYHWTSQFKTTFTFWYASGDDNSGDKDQDNYEAIETDTYGSVVLFEDATFDDAYFVSNKPYLKMNSRSYTVSGNSYTLNGNDPGFLMFRLRADYQATPKLALAAALSYMQFDENPKVTINNNSKSFDDDIGWELDGYVKYELYPGLTIDLVAGYLWAGDGLDAYAFKTTTPTSLNDLGKADDMYRVSLGVTYAF